MMHKKIFFSLVCISFFSLVMSISTTKILATLPIEEANKYLFMACEKGSEEKAAFFIKQGANVNAKNERMVTPLHIACKFGYFNIVKILIANYAEVNAYIRDSFFTPLHCAIVSEKATATNKSNIIRFLLNSGADIDKKTSKGHSALDLVYLLDQSLLDLFANQSSESDEQELTNNRNWLRLVEQNDPRNELIF